MAAALPGASSSLAAYEASRSSSRASPRFCSSAWCLSYSRGGRCGLNSLMCAGLLMVAYYAVGSAVVLSHIMRTTRDFDFPSRALGVGVQRIDVLGGGGSDSDPAVISARVLTRNALATGVGLSSLDIQVRALGATAASGVPTLTQYELLNGGGGAAAATDAASVLRTRTRSLHVWPSVTYDHYRGPYTAEPLTLSSLAGQGGLAARGYTPITSDAGDGHGVEVELAPVGVRAWVQSVLALLSGQTLAPAVGDPAVNASSVADLQMSASASVWPTALLPLGARLRLSGRLVVTPMLTALGRAARDANSSQRFSFAGSLIDLGVQVRSWGGWRPRRAPKRPAPARGTHWTHPISPHTSTSPPRLS